MTPTPERGFTLIELMITIVVIAILASIAIPSYRGFLIRSQRTDARAALLRIQANEEKFFLQNNTYTDNLTAAPPAGLGMSNESDNRHYTLAVTLTGGGRGYTATATPRAGGGQTSDAKCTSFTIDSSGTKTATGSDVANCWR